MTLAEHAATAAPGDVPPFPALDAPPLFGLTLDELDDYKSALAARGLDVMQRGEDGRVFVARHA